jgi:hypothetical protein
LSLVSLLQRWIWRDRRRRAARLLSFAETEADGGRDLARAAERTRDPLLRRLYLKHAQDEQKHAVLFRDRGAALLDGTRSETLSSVPEAFAPGERGLDDLRVDDQGDDALLAFLHLSEKSAASQFAHYRDAIDDDEATRAVFSAILSDEGFHMRYTAAQLRRIAAPRHGWVLWRARLSRLWKAYLRFATALAGVIGTVLLTIQYFVLVPPFAWLAKRAARRDSGGWIAIAPRRSLKGEY